ncbi:MAG: queuosine precursor transporter [Bacteroidales bacterium]|nr:queuosine precursor transporter [Candidatus Scybalousia scybalohippi]
MKKTDRNLYILYMIFGTMLITANCVASKIFTTGINLFGAPITLTSGALAYPFTFLMTDIIGEIWGKEKANIAVKGGFICQLLSTALIIICRYFPATDAAMQESYVTLLGQNWVFVIASLVAYVVSQSIDVKVFHTIREAYIKKHGSTKGGKWIWNNGSTMTSQLVDSIIYATIAFGLGFGWLFQPGMRIVLFNMILGQWLFKIVIAAFDTPLFYFFTRHNESK